EQQRWLVDQMSAAPKDACLLLAVHHPPYSLDTTHGGYPEIELAIDSAIHATGRIPSAVLSGHVHSYQRYERTIGKVKVPYIVAGAGGHAKAARLMHTIQRGTNGKPPPPGFPTTRRDLKMEHFVDIDPSYVRGARGRKRPDRTA